MANWTVSSWTNNEVAGDSVNAGTIGSTSAEMSGGYVDLTISPIIPYVVSATNFKIGGATETPTNTWTGGNVDAEVYNVVFSDYGTAATVGNTVNARVYFDSTAIGGTPWTMPTSDDTIYIDIDEKVTITEIDRYVCVRSHHFAETSDPGTTPVNKHTVTYATAPTGITTSNDTPLIHNIGDGLVQHTHFGTVVQGPAAPGAQVFQVTFTSNALYGYYYMIPPNVNIVTGTYSPYWQVLDTNLIYSNVTVLGTTVSKLTSITYTAYYTPPVGVSGLDPDPMNSGAAMCELGQLIEFDHIIRQEDQGEPGADPEIKSVGISTGNISPSGETRTVYVTGDNTAQFNLSIVSSDSGKTYDFNPSSSSTTAGGDFTAPTTYSGPNTIGNSGAIQFDVTFPATSVDLYYDVIIDPIPPTTAGVGVPVTAGDLRVYQYINTIVTLSLDDSQNVWDDGEFPTVITLTGRAGRQSNLYKDFEYTITQAMVTAGATDIEPKGTLSFLLDTQNAVTTAIDGNVSSATFDVDSTTGIDAGVSIDWSITKYPIFSSELTSEIQLTDAGSIAANSDNIVVGMRLTADNIRSEILPVTVTSVSEGVVVVDKEIALNTKVPLLFTSNGVTISSITDGNTLVASQSLSGLKDNLSLSFAGQSSAINAFVTGGTSVQSGDNVVLAGRFNVSVFPVANTTVKLDIDKLINIP